MRRWCWLDSIAIIAGPIRTLLEVLHNLQDVLVNAAQVCFRSTRVHKTPEGFGYHAEVCSFIFDVAPSQFELTLILILPPLVPVTNILTQAFPGNQHEKKSPEPRRFHMQASSFLVP